MVAVYIKGTLTRRANPGFCHQQEPGFPFCIRRFGLFGKPCSGNGGSVLASGRKRGYTIAVRGYPPRVGTAHNSRKGKGGYQPCGACF